MYYLPVVLAGTILYSPDLHYSGAAAAGSEVKGKHKDYVNQYNCGSHTGASCFSPVVNIARDPRWVRIQVQ